MSLTQYRQRSEPTPMLFETDIEVLLGRLWRRSLRRGWHLPLKYYDRLGEQWSDHAGPLEPTTLCLRLGKGIDYDWKEALDWVGYEADARGLGLNLDFLIRPGNLRAYPTPGDRFTTFVCGPIGLDLTGRANTQSFSLPELVLPNIEVMWLLALNPEYLVSMDGERVPFLTMPGFEVGKNGVPVVARGNTGILVYATNRNNPHVGVAPSYRPLR